MATARPTPGRPTRARVCCLVMVRWRRPRPRNATAQLATAETRFLNPVRKARWTTSHTSHASGRRSAAVPWPPPPGTARSWPSCRDRGREGLGGRPRSRRTIVRAAWRPLCIATSARPGRPSSAIRSPTTKTSGWPGQRAVGLHLDAPRAVDGGAGALGQQSVPAATPARRPPRSSCGPRCGRPSRSRPVGVDADDAGAEADLDAEPLEVAPRPPAQPLGERSEARCRARRAGRSARSSGRSGGSCAPSARRDSSAIWPASSTPVGPAPTIANVSHGSRAASSGSSSAISKAPKIRPRSSSASSIVFIPGA